MRGTLYLLDTNVLLALIRGNELGKFIRHTLSVENTATRFLISIVSHGELWAIAERRNWQSNKRDALRTMLDRVVTIDLNANEIVRSYVEIDELNQAAQKGARQVSHNDMWIAATAKASNAALVTTDQDFLHLHPHYLVVIYIDPQSRLASATTGNQPGIQ
ncbi:MAG TPA: PIN domain-containing protein [Candidatus Angelobacter sp.]|nr:MAG: hypothetical protein DMG65_04365 [Candidatus Angelobacter sp. Gp1-AA117]HMC32434.1 PIN domain-containing protein [Candidatus Angelobacter sp.]